MQRKTVDGGYGATEEHGDEEEPFQVEGAPEEVVLLAGEAAEEAVLLEGEVAEEAARIRPDPFPLPSSAVSPIPHPGRCMSLRRTAHAGWLG